MNSINRAIKYLSIYTLLSFSVSYISSAQSCLPETTLTPENAGQVEKLFHLQTLYTNQSPYSLIMLNQLDISPHGRFIAVQHVDMSAANARTTSLQVWDVCSRLRIQEYQMRLLGNHVLFTDDETKMVIWSFDSVSIYDVASGSLLQEWTNIHSVLKTFVMHPNGEWLTFFDQLASTLIIWDVGQQIEIDSIYYPNRINELAYNHTGTQLALRNQDGAILTWEVTESGLDGEASWIAEPEPWSDGLRYSSDDAVIATYSNPNIWLLDLVDHSTEPYPSSSAILDLLDTNSRNVLLITDNGLDMLFDIQRREELSVVQERVIADMNSEETMYLSSTGIQLIFREVATGSQVGTLRNFPSRPQDVIMDINFSPDSRYVAVAVSSGALEIYGIPPTS